MLTVWSAKSTVTSLMDRSARHACDVRECQLDAGGHRRIDLCVGRRQLLLADAEAEWLGSARVVQLGVTQHRGVARGPDIGDDR